MTESSSKVCTQNSDNLHYTSTIEATLETKMILLDVDKANSKIEETILEADCEIQDAVLCRSLVGIQAKIQGRGDGQTIQLNVGDNSDILLS